MANRDFEIEMRLKADFKRAQQELGLTEDGVDSLSSATQKASAALDKSTEAQGNRLREMVRQSMAQIEAAQQQVEAVSAAATGGGSDTAGIQQNTAARRAQLDGIRATQQAISQEISLIGELDKRLARSASSMDDLADTEARLDAAMSKGLISAEEYDDALVKLAKEQDRLEAAQAKSSKTIDGTVARYDRAGAQLSKLARDEAELKAAVDAGRISREQYNRAMTQLTAQRANIDRVGQSARQTANAMRQLPAQITDIVTGLATGQAPLTVFLQQGGQLKDSFGGAVPALRAVGSAVVAMINPFTALAAAAIALGTAWKQGVDEVFEFQRGLIVSGQSAAVSAEQFRQLVAGIDQIDGVARGTAVDALTAVASSGALAGQNIEGISAAAAKMKAATGKEIGDTVKIFEQLAERPVETLLALNSAEGFLTEAQARRIVSLRNEGNEQQATAEAIQIYMDRIDEVKRKTDEAMPAMVRWWAEVKDEASGTWGEVKELTLQIDGLLGRLRSKVDGAGTVGSFLYALISPTQQMKRLNEVIGLLTGSASALPTPIAEPTQDDRKAVNEQTNEAQALYKRISDGAKQATSNSEKLSAATEQLRKDFIRLREVNQDSGLLTDVLFGADGSVSGGEFDRQLKALQGQYKDRSSGRTGGKSEAQRVDDASARELENLQKQIALLGELGEGEAKVSEAARIRYEIEEGAYRNATPARQQELIDQAMLLDSERALREEQKRQQEEFKKTEQAYGQLKDALRTPAEVALETAIERVEVLNKALSEGIASTADYQQQLGRIVGDGFSKPPEFGGLDAAVGGVSSEQRRIDQERERLQTWYTEQLSLLTQFREQKIGTEQEWNAQELEIERQHQEAMKNLADAQTQVTLMQAEQGFGAMADMAKTFGGEQSKTYQALFAISKGFAIAQAAVSLATNVAKASEMGYPWNLAAIAGAMAQGAQIASLISQATYGEGYATGGHIRGAGNGTSDSIPIWASSGEFMTRAAVVAQKGALPFLEDFNERGMPAVYDWANTANAHFANGGMIAEPAALPAPNWQEMHRRQEAAASAPQVNTALRVLNFIDPDDLSRALADSREFEKTVVNTSINNGRKIRGGWEG